MLSEFARTLSTDFPIQGILDHLVQRIVDILPIDAAGVTLISPTTEPRFIDASDESASGASVRWTSTAPAPEHSTNLRWRPRRPSRMWRPPTC